MKNININDIVPQAILVKIADRIARSARGFARATGSKRIPKAIKVGNVKSTQSTASISIMIDTNIAPQALIFERGAKPHSYSARNWPMLVFQGTNGVEGWVRTKSVNHPGMAKRPFLQPAKDKHKEQNKREIAEAVGKNVRLVVRAMAKKI